MGRRTHSYTLYKQSKHGTTTHRTAEGTGGGRGGGDLFRGLSFTGTLPLFLDNAYRRDHRGGANVINPKDIFAFLPERLHVPNQAHLALYQWEAGEFRIQTIIRRRVAITYARTSGKYTEQEPHCGHGHTIQESMFHPGASQSKPLSTQNRISCCILDSDRVTKNSMLRGVCTHTWKAETRRVRMVVGTT